MRLGESQTLGQAIRARRRALGWTQEELADRIALIGESFRQSDVSRLERDKIGLPRRARLERISAALGLPMGELLARSGWAGAELVIWAPPEERESPESSLDYELAYVSD